MTFNVSERTYVGTRECGEAEVLVLEDGERYLLPPRNDLWNHSSDGLEWGYGGSGPAQTALAILAHATGDDQFAIDNHQPFKWDVVANLQPYSWRLPLSNVLKWVADVRRQESGARP